MHEEMRDKDLFVPQLRKSAKIESQSLDGRDLYMLMLCIEFLDSEQFAGELVIGPVDVTNHIIDIAGHTRQQVTVFGFENLECRYCRRVIVQIECDKADR